MTTRNLRVGCALLVAVLCGGLAPPALGLRLGPGLEKPSVRLYELTITNGIWAADCVPKQTILVNGQFPGPPVVGNEGDWLNVTVRNELPVSAVSVHWHGLRQLNNNLNDGAAHVTQCPIGPLESLVYTFKLDKAGTYFYHGHIGLQKSAGLYGMLVVRPRGGGKAPPVPYESEFSLLLDDHYHLTAEEQATLLDLPEPDFTWVGTPQSLLINGVGRYNCSLVPSGGDIVTGDVTTCNSTNPQCTIPVFEVEAGKSYRLRLAQVASLANVNFVVERHSLEVVAADAFAVSPFSVGPEGLDLFTGQTTDVILHADQAVGNYWIRTAEFGQPYNPPFGLAILRYKGAPSQNPSGAPPPMRDVFDSSVSLAQAMKLKGSASEVPRVPTLKKTKKKPRYRPLTLVSSLSLTLPDFKAVIAINNVSLKLPATPFALGIPAGVQYLPAPEDTVFIPWNYSQPAPGTTISASNYYTFPFKSIVDIVLQSSNTPVGVEFHPWHIHGHHFWVLGQGYGPYNASRDIPSLNFVNPPFRYTAMVLPGGWTAVRFRADNPGAWMLHCHIDYHHVLGMQIVFVDGYVPTPPKQTRLCGSL